MAKLEQLLAEAKRRKVHSTAAAYVGVAFVFWQATEIFVPALGLPELVSTVVVVLSLVGFPVAIALSWAFDIAPHDPGPGSRFSTLRRIHERSLWQTMVGYLVASWMVLQVVETLSSLVGLPLWMGRATLLLLVLGGPVVLLTAIAQSRRDSTAAGAVGRFTWRMALMTGAASFAVLTLTASGYLALRSAGIGPIGSLVAKNVIAESEMVVLADFSSSTGDSVLAAIATEALRIDLAQSRTISLLPPARVAEALARMELPAAAPFAAPVARELATREGIKAVIAGDVSRAGGRRLVLSLRLVAAGDGAALAAHRNAVDEAAFIEGIDLLSARLRERVGESLRSIQANPPLERVTTSSIEALRSYAHAERANNRGRPEQALDLLEEAIREDPLFAMAHRKRGVLLMNLVRDSAVARESLRTAYELRDRLTDRESRIAVGSYHYWVTGDTSAAERAYVGLLERHPDDPIGLNNLSVIYRAQGRLEETRELLVRGVDGGVASAVMFGNALGVQFELGRLRDVDAMLDEFGRSFPDHPSILSWRIAVTASRFDFQGLDSLVSVAPPVPTSEPAASLTRQLDRGSVAMMRGRVGEGLAHLGRAMEMEPSLSPLPMGVALAVNEAELWRELGRDPVHVRAEISALLDAQAARRYVEEFESNYASPPDNLRSFLLHARGVIAILEGRFQTAVDFLQQARALTPCATCVLPDLAAAFVELGDTATAISHLEEYLETPQLFRHHTDAYFLWRVLWGLAELNEASGNSAEQVRHLEMFEELWRDADPELRPRVEEAVEKIAQLRAN